MTQNKSSESTILNNVKTFLQGKKETTNEKNKNPYISEANLAKTNKNQSTVIKSIIEDSISQQGIQKIIDNFELNPIESLYGQGHWGRVINNGLKLSQLLDNDNISEKVVVLFGLLHDVKRKNEETHDLDHGYRASQFIQNEMLPYLNITEDELKELCTACTIHDRKEKSNNLTIGVCLDANYLDIPRKGIDIEPSFLNFLEESTVIQEQAEISAMEQKTPKFISEITKKQIAENNKHKEIKQFKKKKPA